MAEEWKIGVQVLTSCVTLVGMWAAGSKKSWAWLVGLGNQALWLVVIFSTGAFGLLPLTVALVVTYTRNHRRWKRDEMAALEAQLAAAFRDCVCGHGPMQHLLALGGTPRSCFMARCRCLDYSPKGAVLCEKPLRGARLIRLDPLPEDERERAVAVELVELYGADPGEKTPEQMIAEAAIWRKHGYDYTADVIEAALTERGTDDD